MEGIPQYPVPVPTRTEFDTLKGHAREMQLKLPSAGTPQLAAYDTGTLTLDDTPIENQTVRIGTTLYKFRADALGTGVKASKALTIATNPPSDTNTVTIGGVVYTFKTNLTGTPGENTIWVLIGSVAESATNLYKAITGGADAGVKYKYGDGAVAHTLVEAVNGSAGVVTVTAKTVGFDGNEIAIAEAADNTTWAGGATALSGGIDAEAPYDVFINGSIENALINLAKAIDASGTEGVDYGTDTDPHNDVTVLPAIEGGLTTTKLKIRAKTIGKIDGIDLDCSVGEWENNITKGGADGLVAEEGKIMYNKNCLYIATGEATPKSIGSWKRAFVHNPNVGIINYTGEYDIASLTIRPSIFIVEKLADGSLILPAADGSMAQIIVCNRSSGDILIKTASESQFLGVGETTTFNLEASKSITFLDYAPNNWAMV